MPDVPLAATTERRPLQFGIRTLLLLTLAVGLVLAPTNGTVLARLVAVVLIGTASVLALRAIRAVHGEQRSKLWAGFAAAMVAGFSAYILLPILRGALVVYCATSMRGPEVSGREIAARTILGALVDSLFLCISFLVVAADARDGYHSAIFKIIPLISWFPGPHSDDQAALNLMLVEIVWFLGIVAATAIPRRISERSTIYAAVPPFVLVLVASILTVVEMVQMPDGAVLRVKSLAEVHAMHTAHWQGAMLVYLVTFPCAFVLWRACLSLLSHHSDAVASGKLSS